MATPDSPLRRDDLLQDPLLRDAPTVEGFKVLDPAVLYAKIGKGGMGAVYRGRHFKLDLDVAVKCLKPSLVAEDGDFVKRFEREARLAASIAHQNVVRVMDVQEKNGLHYLVMEFVRGETADERVKRKGPLAEQEALAILLGATTGLAEAHGRGIVHRDIKPSNIMISLEGRVKLADLGLAKASGSVDGRSMSMATSVIMGTPQYMPPEQWESTDVTPAADVWALGATLWFLLAGREGIASGPFLQIGERIKGQEYPTLRAERADVRKEVHELLEHCVRRDPKDRYPDAKALLRALRHLAVDDEDVLLDPETGSGHARVGVVTPPPRETLLRIRAQIETNPTGKGTDVEPEGPYAAAPTKPAAIRPAPAARASKSAARMPRLQPRSKPKRWLVPLLGVLLAAGFSVSWAMGAFAPAHTVAPATPDVGNEGAPPSDEPATDSKARARTAFARGLLLLPKPGQLDAAIADLELALSLDPTLEQAKVELAAAFGSKAKKAVAANDPDAAYGFAARGLEHKPGDRALVAQAAEIGKVLAVRLRNGITIDAPKADDVFGARQVTVSGKADSPLLKTLRIAAVPSNDSKGGFPADAAPVRVVSGEFTAEVTVAADGPWSLLLEGEDDHGIQAITEPLRVVVDTKAPAVVIAAPGAGVTVAATVAVRGRVVDATLCRVTVNGVAADTSTPGEWTCTLTLGEGPQQLLVEATDAGGRTNKVKQAVRVDATPPELVVASLPAVTNQNELPLQGTVQGLDGGKLTLGLLSLPVGANGAFRTTLPLTSDGRHAFVLTAVDGVGNQSEQRFEVRRDTTPPVVEWSSPDPAAPLPAGEVEVAGSVQDEGAVASVTVNGQPATLRGMTWQAKVQVAAGASGSKLQPVTRVMVVATDAAGNASKPLLRLLQGVAAVPERIDSGIGLTMVFVKPGTFRMGTEGNTGDERAHTVTITKGYWIGETEVTQKQWRDVMGTEPWRGQNFTVIGDDIPATNVSWDDAVRFCAELTERELAAGRLPDGHSYQLPTEAEWEMAGRGGSKVAFCCGDDEGRLGQYAVFAGSRAGEHASPVRGRRKPNDIGLYDMHGNVWEWCADYANYDDGVVTDTYRGDATDPLCISGSRRVSRGGCWLSDPASCRSAVRGSREPALADGFLGFRPGLSARLPTK